MTKREAQLPKVTSKRPTMVAKVALSPPGCRFGGMAYSLNQAESCGGIVGFVSVDHIKVDVAGFPAVLCGADSRRLERILAFCPCFRAARPLVQLGRLIAHFLFLARAHDSGVDKGGRKIGNPRIF